MTITMFADSATQTNNPIPLALVQGRPMVELPQDLYIPPAALRVFLEAFEGPLDLLLYLINKSNIDILDIPIAEITRQYIRYIELMQGLELELAADYLVMAAMLAEIKSRLLLPRVGDAEELENDPRAELVRRLREYEQFKLAAQRLDDLPRRGRDIFPVQMCCEMSASDVAILPEATLTELFQAMRDILRRSELFTHHHVLQEPLSIRERMAQVLERLQRQEFVEFTNLFTYAEGRMGVVVTFISILELLKQGLIDIVQAEIFSPIHIKARLT